MGKITVLIWGFILLLSNVQTANHYVRQGAAGNGTGSDWANAYGQLPASLVRGDTYYIAGGSYPSYTFNTPHSGTSVITLKKASPTDHGTDTGWMAVYGTSQAVFASSINVFRGYFMLDGQYRDERDWFDGNAYGFRIANNGAWQNLIIRDDRALVSVPNVTVKYLYIAAIVGQLPPTGQGYRPYAIDTDTYSSTLRNNNYVFSRVYVEGSNNPFFVRNLTDPIVEYCASSKTCGSSDFHGEVVNLFYSGTGGGVVRYNHFKDCYNGVSGYPRGGGTGVIAIAYTSGAEIYGNIFEGFYCGNGGVAAPWDNDNIKVFNNTFINGGTNTPTVNFPSPATGNTGVGNEAYNNLTVGCVKVEYSGVGTYGNNATENTSVFVDYAAGDFRLARATAAGRVLGAPFDKDRLGTARGADGGWDIGAFEFTAANILLPNADCRMSIGPALPNPIPKRELVAYLMGNNTVQILNLVGEHLTVGNISRGRVYLLQAKAGGTVCKIVVP